MNVPLNYELDELTEENRFVYENEELPSLQEMASCQVVLAIWNGYISRCSKNKWEIPPSHRCYILVKSFGLYSTYWEDTDKLVESLNTPQSIETILKTSLKKVREELQQCVEYFSRGILLCHYPDRIRIKTIKPHWCVWRPNGDIDYLKTAEMMVSSENNDLNLKTKFAIMCEFYMEEKLKTFPLDSLPADFITQLFRIDVVHSTRYWISYLSGDRSVEINAYKMVADCILSDGMGSIRINHFWHRLCEDDQVKAVYNMLVERSGIYCEKWQAVEPLLGSMSWNQQSRLLSMPQASENTIISICRFSSLSKFAIWVWKHCRDIITAEQFCTIIREIISFPREIKKDVFPVLVELWDTARDHHRHNLPTERLYFRDILHRDEYTVNSAKYSSSTYILLNKCIALKSMNERKALITELAVELATGTRDARYIQEILDLNVPNLDDQIEFKKSVMNSEKMMWHCSKLWVNGYFDIFNANVEFYCNSDVNSIREYKQKLLSQVTSRDWADSDDKFVITDINKWHECSELIDKILPDDPSKALVAKQQLVSRLLLTSLYSYKYYRWSNRLCKHLNLAIKTIESVFPNEMELNRVKTAFIKAHPKSDSAFCMRDDLCDDVYFHSMMQWCCDNNEEAVVELKNNIQNHHAIFDIVFFQLNKAYVTEATGLKMSLLTCLDKYLSWYLTSEEEIMGYKMCRLNESDKLAIFTTICEQRDEQSLKMLLGWFFDGDEMKIRDFRSKKMKLR